MSEVVLSERRFLPRDAVAKRNVLSIRITFICCRHTRQSCMPTIITEADSVVLFDRLLKRKKIT